MTDDPRLEAELEDCAKSRRELEQIGLADKLNRNLLWRIALRVMQCGTLLGFECFLNKKTGDILHRLEYANFCQLNKFCPQCAKRYARKNSAYFIGCFQKMNEDRAAHGLPPYRLIFLTLTVRNCPLHELRRELSVMNAGWQRLIQTQRFRKAVTGGFFRGVEYLGDHTAAGIAHPHFHVILIVPPSYFQGAYYISHDVWVAMWRKAMRLDYDPQVNVQTVKPRRKADGTYKSAPVAAAAEVAKYAVSTVTVGHMSDSDFGLLYYQTKGLRQYTLGGKIAEYEPDPPEDLDPELWEYLTSELWKWNQSSYFLKTTEISPKHLPKIG